MLEQLPMFPGFRDVPVKGRRHDGGPVPDWTTVCGYCGRAYAAEIEGIGVVCDVHAQLESRRQALQELSGG